MMSAFETLRRRNKYQFIVFSNLFIESGLVHALDDKWFYLLIFPFEKEIFIQYIKKDTESLSNYNPFVILNNKTIP